MLFDVRTALAKIEDQPQKTATSATSATQTHQRRPHVAIVADVAGHQTEILKSRAEPDCPHTTSPGGRPVTWTGKVVSLSEWRELTDWQRHGPNGKTFNGKTMKWEGER